jgi:signal peptidase II
MRSAAPSRHPVTGFACAIGVFLVDQFIKYMVAVPLALQSRGDEGLYIVPFFSLRWLENYGVSMGFLHAGTDTGRWMLVGMTCLIALFVAIWMLREKNRFDVAALGCILGGALGNILDRIRLGYVIDYADFHIGEWRPFLVFNLADAAITLGVLILLARALLLREKDATTESDEYA